MHKLLAALGRIIAIGGLAAWLIGAYYNHGLNWGWTKTVGNTKLDSIDEKEGEQTFASEKRFSPGLDIMVGCVLVGGGMWGLAIALKKKT